jgi:hypothetical protein
MVCGFEIEIGFAVFGYESVVSTVIATIGLNRGNAVLGRGLGCVEFTGEDGFRIASFENKLELTIRSLLEFKPTSHGESPLKVMALMRRG